MQILGTWLSGFTKVESLRLFNWSGGGRMGFARLTLAYEICYVKTSGQTEVAP